MFQYKDGRTTCSPSGSGDNASGMDVQKSTATRLSENRTVTGEEWNQARALGRQVIRAVDDRAAIVSQRGLDAAFCLPAANWGPDSPNDYLDAYRLLRPLDWNEVRHLRFRSQVFSGFNLLLMRRGAGLGSTLPVPSDLQIAPEPPTSLIHHWERITRDLPDARIYRAPCALGEIGWRIDDRIVNEDVLVYQERMTLLHETGVLDWLQRLGRPPRILEIGAGYGALAYAITSALPKCQYTICDLPESLLFSGLYLKIAGQRRVTLFPERATTLQRLFPRLVSSVKQPGAIELVPNYLFGDLVDARRSYDLVINVLSMSEMSEHQIETYGRGIAALIGQNGMFFEQNQNNKHMPGLTYAADVLNNVLEFRQAITTDIPLTQGTPSIWACNDPAARLKG